MLVQETPHVGRGSLFLTGVNLFINWWNLKCFPYLVLWVQAIAGGKSSPRLWEQARYCTKESTHTVCLMLLSIPKSRFFLQTILCNVPLKLEKLIGGPDTAAGKQAKCRKRGKKCLSWRKQRSVKLHTHWRGGWQLLLLSHQQLEWKKIENGGKEWIGCVTSFDPHLLSCGACVSATVTVECCIWDRTETHDYLFLLIWPGQVCMSHQLLLRAIWPVQRSELYCSTAAQGSMVQVYSG